MPDEFDNQELPDDDVDLPKGDEQDVDTAEDDDDISFDNLTQDEIDAMNAPDDSDSDDDNDADDEGDDDDQDSDDNDGDADSEDAAEDAVNDVDTSAQDNQQRESDTVAQKRADIDAQFDAKLKELEELGEQYDAGTIYDGKYNAQKARIEREIKRIESRESELVSKEDAIAERESTEQEQSQQAFMKAADAFFQRPENSVFVEGSAEHSALDQQLGVVAANMPDGTPFDVLLTKARNVVAAYMDLPEASKPKAEAKPKAKPQEQTMPSISNMPSVVPNSTDGNKFAHLDKLDGPSLERAQAEMTEAQLNEYLNT